MTSAVDDLRKIQWMANFLFENRGRKEMYKCMLMYKRKRKKNLKLIPAESRSEGTEGR